MRGAGLAGAKALGARSCVEEPARRLGESIALVTGAAIVVAAYAGSIVGTLLEFAHDRFPGLR